MLQGRNSERAAVATLVTDAAAGRGGALVLLGLPGVGKSALLADTVARAEGLTALRTQGVESESPLAFAALQRLLWPVRALAAQLPEPQQRALRAVFGEADAGAVDRFLVFLAALSLLAEAAEQAPVLAVVDDAHWLDDASAAALLFVARRLEAERVAILFAARTGDVRTFDSADLPALTLTGIDAEPAGVLLAEHAGVPVPPGVRDALLAGTGGNPLALVELTEALSAEQLSGAAPLPERLPLTGGVERAFLDRCRRLSDAAQTLLLVAAADDSGRVAVVRVAAAELDVVEQAMEEAERSGLLAVRDGGVELRHPLVRSAVYGAATSTERRRVHRALAAALEGSGDDDRRAWHLAASVEQPDAAVVDALDAAAERALRRGGHEAASAAWERAAELSVGGDRVRRLAAAAESAWLAARPGRARLLADSALAQAVDPVDRCDLQGLRAHVEFNTGSLDAGLRLVLQAAQQIAPHDAGRAAQLGMLAAALAAVGARAPGLPEPAALVPEPSADACAADRCRAHLTRAFSAVARADWHAATPHLRAALDLADALDDAADGELLLNLGVGMWYLGDDQAALDVQTRLLAHARGAGAVVLILHALTRRGLTDIATGRWAEARAGAEESLALADGSGQPALAALPHAVLGLLSALRDGDAGEHVTDVERIARSAPLGILTGLVGDLLAWVRAATARNADQALQRLEQLTVPAVQQTAALDRVEFAVHAGRPDLGKRWVEELAEFADATGAAWAVAAVEHGRALLADGTEAQEHFDRALAAHERSLRRPDRARTQLAYGSHLRRARRRVDARAHLRGALAAFEELGAEAWAERARQELRSSGESARRRTGTGSDAPALTPSERQVTRLVREGLSNRDIAARLFLSPRTIDFHLRNAFAKLGVSSRTELAALPLD